MAQAISVSSDQDCADLASEVESWSGLDNNLALANEIRHRAGLHEPHCRSLIQQNKVGLRIASRPFSFSGESAVLNTASQKVELDGHAGNKVLSTDGVLPSASCLLILAESNDRRFVCMGKPIHCPQHITNWRCI